VITDPAELEAARKAAAARQVEDRQYEDRMLVMLAASDSESFEQLVRAKSRIVPILRTRLSNLSATGRGERAEAAFTLLRLGDPEGTAVARGLVKDPAAASAVLPHVANLSAAQVATLPGLERLVLSQLDSGDDRVFRSAVEGAAAFKTPAATGRLLALVRSGKDQDGRAAWWLSQTSPSSELLTLCAARLRAAKPGDRNWWLMAAAEMAEAKSAGVADAAVEVCGEALARTRSEFGMDGGMLAALEALEKHRGGRSVPLLADLVTHGNASPQVRGAALVSLARRDPRAGRELALEQLASPELKPAAVEALGVVGRGSGDEDLVRALVAATTHPGDPEGVSGMVARALLTIGGESALRWVAGMAGRLPPGEQTAVRWAEHGLSKQKGLERVTALKVLDQRSADLARRRFGRSSRDGDGGDAEGPLPGQGFAEEVFEAAGLLTSFDAETGELPVRHDRLVRDFAAHSGGAFKPEAAFEKWDQQFSDDDGAPYTVQFIHAGRLYRFQAANLGDWYDVTAVVGAVNRALADTGETRRFVALEGDGQAAAFAFVDPERYAAAARELFLPPLGDPDAARKGGQAFEAEVVEELRKRK